MIKMMLDRIEFRKEYLNRVFYLMDSRIQRVSGISSRISDDWGIHRILWDLDNCLESEAYNSFRKIQNQYTLGDIIILSDKAGSYGGVCNNEVTFKELLHILIDTDLIDPLFVRYAFQRHEAILRLSDKQNRPIHRRIIGTLYNKTYRKINECDYYTTTYQTGYSSDRLRKGDFINDQRDL
jgi:hypothetical protein